MTTQIASANLISEFTLVPVTGFIKYQQGDLGTDGIVRAQTSGNTWADINSWDNFKSYQPNYREIRWTAPLIDLGSIIYFTLNIETEFDGECYFMIYISDTGLFAGEETEYIIKDGNYNVESFYGRYAYVTAVVSGRELRKFKITTNTDKVTYDINNVNTSTLAGSISERTIALPRTVSKITDIFISPKAPTAYAVNLYVSDTATSQVLIPVVKSKDPTSPTFVLYGIDNDPRDGVVDIKITALPRMVMYAGRLTVVE